MSELRVIDVVQERIKQLGYTPNDEYFEFPDTPFQSIKFVQTTMIPPGVIYIHPLTLGKVYEYTEADKVINIVKRKD